MLGDGHGSTRQLRSASSVGVTNGLNYDAFGTVLGSSSTTAENSLTTKLYCGEQYDSVLGMYNLRARFYNPANGSFNARDSFEGSNFDPKSLHKYAYGNCDPINEVDPSGCFSLTEALVVIGVLLNIAMLLYHVHSAQTAYASGNFRAYATDEAWAMVDLLMLVVPGSGLFGPSAELACDTARTATGMLSTGMEASAVWGYVSSMLSLSGEASGGLGSGGGGSGSAGPTSSEPG